MLVKILNTNPGTEECLVNDISFLLSSNLFLMSIAYIQFRKAAQRYIIILCQIYEKTLSQKLSNVLRVTQKIGTNWKLATSPVIPQIWDLSETSIHATIASTQQKPFICHLPQIKFYSPRGNSLVPFPGLPACSLSFNPILSLRVSSASTWGWIFRTHPCGI